ncbi:Dimethylsulfonioproprionate demethylase DmdA [Roseovarius albus]|uniref:Dimethylsulfonioproprionate demethylase DmdA n=1 Tax=Roseovarius albus TaxID=1247867 RepID=A0A1X6Y5L1_9RHOB|nr:dimethylsulfoniopropionate demethylase [Roseovarius albus]SLN11078.1 Dimethylsulfonioproprionate demethylase DmdA [Roseovarius albus]
MNTPLLSPSRRVRRTPFSDGVEAAGIQAYTVYNHMLLPTMFNSVEEDCRHLKTHVQVWDVSCERQVQIKGPDALRLVELLTPRDLSKMSAERCLYIPMVDQDGGMLNDPVLIEAGPDTYWISIADSDVLMWVNAIAACNSFDVEVTEPDVSPLGVQGPLANELMSRVFNEDVKALRFFGCNRFAFEGHEFLISRSGYSKQGGFEIYVDNYELAMPLWNALFSEGEELLVRAGGPNLIERIEGGLLSYGNDMTRANTPLECGLGMYVNAGRLDTCFGGRALREELEQGSRQMIRPIAIEGHIPMCDRVWPVYAGGKQVGQVTSAAWSPDFETNVSIGMVERSHWDAGTKLEVETHEGMCDAAVQDAFWK